MEKQIILAMPVTSATIMEDRALVERTFTVTLPAGLCELQANDISPLLLDSTLSGRTNLDGVTVKSVSLVRQHRLEPRDPRLAASLEERLAASKRQVGALCYKVELLEKQQAECQELMSLWQEQAASQAFSGDNMAVWLEQYHQLSAAYLQYGRELAGQKGQLRILQAEHDSLSLECKQQCTAVHHYTATLHILVEAAAEVTATITISGIMPCVAWRPAYRARLEENGVSLERQALVWQQSGEDWTNCNLKFSTARPGKGAEIPHLNADNLSIRDKSEEERKVIQVVSQNVDNDNVAAGVNNEALPGVSDGGQVQCFSLDTRVSLPAKPQAQSFIIDTIALDNKVQLEARPELQESAVLVSRQLLSDSRPLLAGPVILQRGDCLVGRAMLEYVAPGQSFELHFGSEDELEIKLDSQPVREDAKGSKNNYHYSSVTNVRNLGASERTMVVTFRLPVSENEEIEVIMDGHTTAGYSIDDNGFVSWVLTLDPHSQQDIKFTFDVLTGKKVQWIR